MRVLLAAAVLLFLGPAVAAAQGDQRYTVDIVLLPTHVTVATDDVVYLYGANASAFRGCLDAATGTGYTNCPGKGDADGIVEPAEVDKYEQWFMRRLNRQEGQAEGSGPCEFSPGHAVRIDGHTRNPPCSNVVSRWEFQGAEGPVASTALVWLDHTVVMYYPNSDLQESIHPIEYAKAEDERRDRAYNNHYTVRLVPGGSWRLDADSVEPAWARERRESNALVFTDEDPIEGEAVRFNITGPGDGDLPPARVDGDDGQPQNDSPGLTGVGALVALAVLTTLRRRKARGA